MLDLSNLSFDYPDKPLLAKVQFSLAAGELLHLKGANGSGKTTLLKILSGLLHPDEGEIRYNGELIHKNLSAYQHKLCYVGHKAGISSLLTVKENCYFDLHWGRSLLSFDSLLEDFGLQGLEDEPCYRLSAGQRRRVSLLKIVMTDASLWLLDEPLIALDAKAIKTLVSCLENHVHGGGQVILTSHQNLPMQQPYQVYSL